MTQVVVEKKNIKKKVCMKKVSYNYVSSCRRYTFSELAMQGHTNTWSELSVSTQICTRGVL